MSEPIATATTTPPAPELKPKANRAYSSAIMIRIRPEQNERLHQLAAEAGMSLSTYIRVKLKLEKPRRGRQTDSL